MQILQQIQSTTVIQAFAFGVVLHSAGTTFAASGNTPPPTVTPYQFTYIEIPGNTFMAPFTPTGQGTTAGFYNDSEGGQHGFLWRDGQVSYLITPTANTFAPASGINNHGQVVGSIVNPDGSNTPYIYSVQEGTWTVLPDVPNLPLLGNQSINNAGIVVGSGFEGTLGNVGYIWDGTSYSFFTVPGADESGGVGTFPMGMNDRGQICGQFQDLQGNVHGFIKDGSRYIAVDVPGADQTWCIAMNNHEDVVGVYYVFDPIFQEQGYILHKGQFFTFPTPGFGALTGINDSGVVAGTYTEGLNDPWHGFIATPHGDMNPQP